ncbi:MAG: bifunctional diaminohydroxyphosphoribosylaminopyrimidine deaminase/5-amino-6-(5-phosphoribosylamino)uracil reductase RibD [Alphaproteobacteria bacterium]|nr:bifunctional diaminohydroxyphosphoribosylaminopyrimidine deaminase/5-amino-6-(5-phosphoribosylamino)uracil reductase RibD [Alphaproteobacteria bacterium]
MRVSMDLARQGWGRVWPNPAVGCVIAKDGYVVGRARTQDGGRPHAETAALAQAGDHASGADVYVTLEPCAHHGKTPPCAEALINAGVRRVVVGVADPDPRVNGKGIEKLRQAGIIVETPVMAEACRDINLGFFLKTTQHRPMITLKTASTLDGFVAMASGESKWITGDLARAYGRLERAEHDAVAVGVGTILADNPVLTARLSVGGHEPICIVFDTNLRSPFDANIFKNTDKRNVWIVCQDKADEDQVTRFTDLGVRIIPVPLKGVHLDLKAAVSALAEAGLTRVLVEGGATLTTSFLKAGLYDRLLWFRSPDMVGAGARPAVGDMQIHALSARLGHVREEIRMLGTDILEIYRRKP